jgi:hypothetical protein
MEGRNRRKGRIKRKKKKRRFFLISWLRKG